LIKRDRCQRACKSRQIQCILLLHLPSQRDGPPAPRPLGPPAAAS
jgi:hypothetical protein